MYDVVNLLDPAEAAEGYEWPDGQSEVVTGCPERVVGTFESLEMALTFCREKLVSGRATPHEHHVRPTGPNPSGAAWGAPSAYNMLTPDEED